jgi:fluoride ion exporter CrcB/FEX
LRAKVLLAVFFGGALGTLARFAVGLFVDGVNLENLAGQLVATSIVNLAGAFLLGVVHSIGTSRTETWKAFFGPGLAGGFTTMSGLALITAGSELGLSSVSYLYWLAVSLQLALGVLAYWFGKQIADSRKSKAGA